MDLWQLRTFEAVARTLNFTRAAEDLNLSQPAVSHQIKALEKEVGKALFDREKSGVSLTSAGKAMIAHVRSILDTADALLDDLADQSLELSGTFIVGLANRGLDNPLDEISAVLQKKYPHIELIIHSSRSVEKIIPKIIDGTIDIGIVVGDMDLSDVSTVPYGSFELLLVVGRNHRLAKKKSIKPEELANEDWVLFDHSSRLRSYTENCFAKAGFKPKSVYESNDGALIRSIVAKGQHVSCLPSWGIVNEVDYGRVVPISVEGWERVVQLNVVWKRNRKSRALSAVINFLMESNYRGATQIEGQNGVESEFAE